jgi:hypothetical protein
MSPQTLQREYDKDQAEHLLHIQELKVMMKQHEVVNKLPSSSSL